MGVDVATSSKFDSIEVVVAQSLQPDFPSFYQETYSSVTRALSATIRDVDLAAEATDEAMARAYASWSKVQRYDNPAGWVYRVGLNWAISVQRRRNRKSKLTTETVTPPVDTVDPSLYEALGDLDPKLRSVVVCRYLLDWSTEQTAEALAIRSGTVKSRLHRALEQLSIKLSHLKETA